MFPKLTVRESLDMGRIASGRVRRDRTDEVLEYFPHLRDRLGHGARRFAERFTWERAADATEAHLSAVLGSAA